MSGHRFATVSTPGGMRVRACALGLCVLGLFIPVQAVFASPPPAHQDAAANGPSAPAAPAAPRSLINRFVEWGDVAVPTSPGTAHCSLDVISGRPAPMAIVADHQVPLTLVGWAADDKHGVPLEIVFVLMGSDKNWGVVGKAGLPRPDVVDVQHNPAFADSGYSITGDPAAIPQGEYHAVLIERFGKTENVCPLGRTIAVK
jgi:hypothetical protein